MLHTPWPSTKFEIRIVSAPTTKPDEIPKQKPDEKVSQSDGVTCAIGAKNILDAAERDDSIDTIAISLLDFSLISKHINMLDKKIRIDKKIITIIFNLGLSFELRNL